MCKYSRKIYRSFFSVTYYISFSSYLIPSTLMVVRLEQSTLILNFSLISELFSSTSFLNFWTSSSSIITLLPIQRGFLLDALFFLEERSESRHLCLFFLKKSLYRTPPYSLIWMYFGNINNRILNLVLGKNNLEFFNGILQLQKVSMIIVYTTHTYLIALMNT